ncbi:MAG: protein-disulfide reductase DsbD family protein [Kiloniellales bacterium]
MWHFLAPWLNRPSRPCKRRIAWLCALLLVSLTAAPQALWAAAGSWQSNDQAKLRLIAAQEAVGESTEVRLGLHFELEPGWKIYWRSPGDAGYPPEIDWSGSENLAATEVSWPVPHRFSLFGLETFGYSDEVVLPIAATLATPGQPLALKAAVDYLICEEICIPHQATLSLALPAGPARSGGDAFLLARYQALVPGSGAGDGLGLERVQLTGSREMPRLEVVARSELPFAAPDLLVEGPSGFSFGKPEVTLSDGGKRARLAVSVSTAPGIDRSIEAAPLTLTLFDGTRALEREVTARFVAGAESVGVSELAAILALALLGGFILNFMPCVLPVLSMKLVSVAQQGGRAAAAVRSSFLATAAGIVFSFLLLALVAVALKGAGLAVGWGMQFQQPLFLTAMALVVTLFAANLFDLFEIALPQRLAGFATPVAGRAGADPSGKQEGLAGAFATGVFATLLATPCSAPFLGTAVGFALARGWGEIAAIFLALGLGLATPYLAVAAVPRLAAWLPRPGPWMATLKRLMGIALLGTALWLASVLAAQLGRAPALMIGSLLAGLFLALVAWRFSPRPMKTLAPGLAVVLGLSALALPLLPPAERPPARSASGIWQPLEESRIAGLVADGKVVFVDVTAEWCVTCLANRALVLERAPVAERLVAPGLVALQGDWTRPDPAIAAYLERFGRYGIPFNAVYGPGAPEGIALPELLTSEAVLAALSRAAGDG